MKNNKGSSIIEITIIFPIVLFVVYFYIMYLLLCINLSKNLSQKAEGLYDNNGSSITVSWDKGIMKAGDTSQIEIEINKNNNDPVKEVRRWQCAHHTIP